MGMNFQLDLDKPMEKSGWMNIQTMMFLKMKKENYKTNFGT
ncbi:hypothetical protein MalM14_55540 [Gimesia chilikensis]|nr:hypothetical protein MalM14_55540 [Gimesia chilikensis]